MSLGEISNDVPFITNDATVLGILLGVLGIISLSVILILGIKLYKKLRNE